MAGVGTTAMMTMGFRNYPISDSGSKKGIGCPYYFPDDLKHCDWWYNWSAHSPGILKGFVPMSWGGEDPVLACDYGDYVLLFNEPDRTEQSNITPAKGFEIYKELKQKYPHVKWVIGNVFYPEWLYEFKALCQDDFICGIHAYIGEIEYLPNLITCLDIAHEKLGGEFWITEFACIFGDVRIDQCMVDYFNSREWITRYAYFCNRAKGDEWWYPHGWDVRLFDYDTGDPTKIGKWFIDGLHRINISAVIR